MTKEPSDLTPQDDLAKKAGDPSTSLQELYEIARDYPQLRPVIALNPSTYQELLDWLADNGDAATKEALKKRNQSGPAAFSDQQTEVLSPVAAQATFAAGAQAANAPANAESDESEGIEKYQRKNRTMKILIAILVVLAAVLAGTALYLSMRPPVGSDNPESQPAASEGVSEDNQQPEATEEQTTEEQTEAELVFPAPDGAMEAPAVQAPSGNIVCSLKDDAVTCRVIQTNGSLTAGSKCANGSVIVQADKDGVSEQCGKEVKAQGATSLAYGEYAQNGNVACLSQFNGMTCWNQVTGQSFAVSRSGWIADSKGQIPESKFPWYVSPNS